MAKSISNEAHGKVQEKKKLSLSERKDCIEFIRDYILEDVCRSPDLSEAILDVLIEKKDLVYTLLHKIQLHENGLHNQ